MNTHVVSRQPHHRVVAGAVNDGWWGCLHRPGTRHACRDAIHCARPGALPDGNFDEE
jgi:hypothetical protein